MLDSRLFALFAFVLLVVKVESSAAQSPITISGVIQHVTCYGNNNGAINITVNGGVPPYSYSWSNSATTEDISGLTAGAYSVTVTASNGSTKNASFTVNQPSALSVNISIQNSNCGASNGKVTASASGGTPPYSYQWSTGHTTQTVNALYGGTYYVTVTDAAGCSVIQQVYVPIGNSNQYITGTVSSTPVTCYGGSNGTASVYPDISGSHSYAWSNGGTTQTITNVPAGWYTVTVTRPNSCTTVFSVYVSQPPPYQITSQSQNVSCYGGSDGSASVSVTGNTPPYNYSWSTSPTQTAATATGLQAGTYTVNITDTNNCPVSATVTVSQPPQLSVSIASFTPVACYGGATGTATASVTGGTSGYSYVWSTSPVQTGASASNLSAGSYTVTVTDQKGCSNSASVTVPEPPALSPSIGSMQNVSCTGGYNGQASVAVTGGTPGYSYLWSTVPSQTASLAQNLGAGTYSVTVTDANSCQATVTVTITEPPVLTATITAVNHAECKGSSTGSATVSAAGGAGPYTYSWSTSPAQAGTTAASLSAGTYTVTVTDQNGCIATASVTITEPSMLTASISAVQQVSCNGGNNGSAIVTASGGTPGYSYLWSSSPSQSAATAQNLPAGSYTVTVTDNNSCQASATVTITQPAPLTVSISSIIQVSCHGGADGSATVNAAGGTGPYTYSWNTSPLQTAATAAGLAAGSYTATVTDQHGCTVAASVAITQPPLLTASISSVRNVSCNEGEDGMASVTVNGGTPGYSYAWSTSPVQTASIAQNFLAGSYNVLVTDANNCQASASVTITQPPPLSVTINSYSSVSCSSGSDGSATAAAAGGTPGYIYSWSTSPQQSGPSVSGLISGTYTVAVTDSNGCTSSASISITEPLPLLLHLVSVDHVSCYGSNDGSVAVAASGGTPGYSYSWSTSPMQASQVASSLSAGTYTASVTDSNGCSATNTVTVTQPAPLAVGISSSENVTCYNGTNGVAAAFASGGTPSYTYSWSSSPSQSTSTASGLGAGTYTVVVEDDNGCKDSTTVTITEPPALNTVISGYRNASCSGFLNGWATVSVNGGIPGYTYVWNTVPPQYDPTANGLGAGAYQVIVSDQNECTDTASVVIAEPFQLQAFTSSQNNASCYGYWDGSASLSVTGGTAPYSFLWNTNPAQLSAAAGGLGAGEWTVDITDSNGCFIQHAVIITQPAAPLSIATSSSLYNGFEVSCFGANDGYINAVVAGGTPQYSYVWAGPNGFSSASPGIASLSAGTYSLTVTDQNGCISNSVTELKEPQPVNVVLSAAIYPGGVNTICSNDSSGFISASCTGGTGQYSYSWIGPNGYSSSSPSVAGAWNGTYYVTVGDANSCVASDTITLVSPQPIVIALAAPAQYSGTHISCYGASDGLITAGVSGGVGGYYYIWAGPDGFTSSASQLSSLPAGAYSITVSDTNGCMAYSSITLNEPAALQLSATASDYNGSNITCNGANDGYINAAASGGSSPYTYTWSGPGGYSSSGASVSSLGAGAYHVTVTDLNGCAASDTFMLEEPAALALSANVAHPTCNGSFNGSVDITVAGGTAPYNYQWSSGSTMEDLQVVDAGYYWVTAADANGCGITDTFLLTAPPAIIINLAVIDAACSGVGNGSIDLSAAGGVGPYSFAWSNGMQAEDISGLGAGAYSVSVTDANGCAAQASAVVNNLYQLELSSSVHHNPCYGDSLGHIEVTVMNGTGPYNFQWSNGSNASYAYQLHESTYWVTVTDYFGCSVQDTFKISSPLPLSVALYSPVFSAGYNLSGFQSQDGSITANASGGTMPYQYQWSTGSNEESISGLPAGSYYVTVTDTNGCSAAAGIDLKEPMPLSIPSGYSPNGDGHNDYFMIQGIDAFPENELVIYNRWGNEVYSKTNYSNDWDGLSNNGKQLPEGTYFVLLRIPSLKIVMNSYVDLRRN
jgi:large repetitive protein